MDKICLNYYLLIYKIGKLISSFLSLLLIATHLRFMVKFAFVTLDDRAWSTKWYYRSPLEVEGAHILQSPENF